MNKTVKHYSKLALLVALVTGCTSTGPVLTEGVSRNITILHTNDHHGRFWKNKRGEYGMSARKTLIDKIRNEKEAKGDIVLLLSGGDINTGVPESDIQDAEPDFKGMEAIGYDAMAIGNHEFDNPLKVLRGQQQLVNFPFLAANIYDKASGKRLFKPYKIFNKKGLTIAVIGLTTNDTIKIGNPEFLAGMEFRSPIEEAKALVPELRKKADLVIAVTHMGHYQNGEHTVNAPGDVALARAVDGIDLVVGGHSQEPVCVEGKTGNYDSKFGPGKDCKPDRQNGAWIVQAFEWGKYVGQADLAVTTKGSTLNSYALIPVNLKVKKKDANGKTVKDAKGKTVRVFATKEIAEDAKIKALLEPYQKKGEKGLNEVIGRSNGALVGERDKIRFIPTNLGFLIAESQRLKSNADVAVMNSGGIRASIDAGDITYKDILIVQPFGNSVSVLDVSGKELLDYLKIAASKPVDTGAYAQFAGVDIKIRNNKLIKVTVGGKPIYISKTYNLSLNSFLASGGDGYPKMDNKLSFVNTGFIDADVLKEFLEDRSPILIEKYKPTNVDRK